MSQKTILGIITKRSVTSSKLCTDLYFIICSRHRCSVRTYISSDAVSIGAAYGPIFHQMLQASVPCTDVYFIRCSRELQYTDLYYIRYCRHRGSVRNYISTDPASIGTLHGRIIHQILQASLQCTDISSDAPGIGAVYGPIFHYSTGIGSLYRRIFNQMLLTSVLCADVYYIRFSRHRCSVRTCISSCCRHIYGRIFYQVLSVAMLFTEV